MRGSSRFARRVGSPSISPRRLAASPPEQSTSHSSWCSRGRRGEVIAGRNGRNAKVVALVAALALANIAFHIDDARIGLAEYSTRGALAFIVMPMLLIGGRVTPSFTNNWLAKAGVGERPVPFGRADGAVLAGSGLSLAAWVVAPEGPATGALLLAVGFSDLWRLSRWRGLAARRDALVLVLHAGYLFAALGFLIAGAAAPGLDGCPMRLACMSGQSGASGVITLAMMTRATLGQSGRALIASSGTRFAYACLARAHRARGDGACAGLQSAADAYRSNRLDCRVLKGRWRLGPVLRHGLGDAPT